MENTEQTTETTEVKIISPELKELIPQNLPSTDAEIILSNFSPFFPRMAEIKTEMSKINFENPTELDSIIAGNLKRKTVKIRTGAEATKKIGKENILIVGKLFDSANGVIGNSCRLLEQKLEAVENFAEIKEAARKKLLKEERITLIAPLVTDGGLDLLDEMTETQFTAYFDGLKSAHEKNAEQERVEEEAKLKLHELRKEQILPYWNFNDKNINNRDFSSLTEIEWLFEFYRCKKETEILKAEQARVALENEQLKSEKEAKDKLRAIRIEELRPFIVFIRDFNNLINLPELEYQKEFECLKLAKNEQETFDKIEALKKVEREEKEQEERFKKENERIKILKEEKITYTDLGFLILTDENFSLFVAQGKKKLADAELAIKKIAEKQPDKEKIKTWIKAGMTVFNEIKLSGLKSNEAQKISMEIQSRLIGWENWANELIEKI